MKITSILFLLVFIISCSAMNPKGPPAYTERMPAGDTSTAVNPALKKIEEVNPKAVKEKVVLLSDAKVVMADYPLLRKDFPELRNLSSAQIDEWLIKNTAVMSMPQSKQENVNTKINSWAVKDAYRPPEYGRALVIPVSKPYAELGTQEIGLIDAKGVGSLNPALRDHGDGLATLGECIREFVYEKMVNRLFQHSGTGMKTVGTYAVIDSGFSLKHTDKSTSPGGIVLRQAHTRYESRFSLFSEADSLRIENILRRYGVTSAGAYRDQYQHKINIQGTKQGAVLDFGGFLTVYDFYDESIHFYGRDVLINPRKPGAVHPDKNFRVPLDLWGTTVSGKEDPKLDNVWLWSHELASSFREGTASRSDVNQHVKNLLGPVYERLNMNVPDAGGPQNCLELINNLLN